MKVNILSIAEHEFVEAVKYYNEKSAGLGYEFASELKCTIDRIKRHPLAWTKLNNSVRRCRCKRFPYGVVYKIDDDIIRIICIMHLQQRPEYWKDRV